MVRYFRRKLSEASLGINRSDIATYNSPSSVRKAFLRLHRAGVVSCSPGREKWPGGPKDHDLWQLRSYFPRYTVEITGPSGTDGNAIACMSWLEVVCAIDPAIQTLPAAWVAAFDRWRPPDVRADAGAEALCASLAAGKSRCDRAGHFTITAAPPDADEMTITVTKNEDSR